MLRERIWSFACLKPILTQILDPVHEPEVADEEQISTPSFSAHELKGAEIQPAHSPAMPRPIVNIIMPGNREDYGRGETVLVVTSVLRKQ